MGFFFFFFCLVEKKISSSFSVIRSKYFGIFFVYTISKSDKNPDLIIKNSSLYKLDLTVALPSFF